MFKMRLRKQILTMVMSVCMLTQSLPVTAFAAESEVQTAEQAAQESTDDTDNSTEEPVTEEKGSAAAEETIIEESHTEKEALQEENSTEETAEEISEETTEGRNAVENSSTDETAGQNRETAEEINTEEKDTVEESSTEELEEEMTEEAAQDEIVRAVVQENTLTEGSSITVTAVSGSDQGFVFEAPENGEYQFWAQSTDNTTGYIYFYNRKDDSGYSNKEQYLYTTSVKATYVPYMLKGEKKYIRLEANSSAGGTFQIGVNKMQEGVSLTKTENGYRADTNEFSVDISLNAGYKSITFEAALTAKQDTQLEQSYTIKAYACTAGSTHKQQSNVSLYSPEYKGSDRVKYLTMETEYVVSMYLCDAATGDVRYTLISEKDDVRVTTKKTTEDIFIEKITADYKSVTFDYEVINTGISYYMYYAPLSDPSNENRKIVYSGNNSVSITGLNDDTEYLFYLLNSTGDRIAEYTAKTDKYPATVTYDIQAAGSNSISIKAEVSDDTTGQIPNSMYLYYIVADADGTAADSGGVIAYKNSDNKLVYDITADFLEAAKTYRVTTWLSDSSSMSQFAKRVTEITTEDAAFDAEDVEFTLTPHETEPQWVNYSITVKNDAETLPAQISYRIKDSNEQYATKKITILKGQCRGYIANIQKGAEYELVLNISGVIIKKSYTNGTAEYNGICTNDTEAYDAVLTFKLVPTDTAQYDKDWGYKVQAYYMEDERFKSLGSAQELTSDNAYSAEVKTGSYVNLTPNTTYPIKWMVTINGAYTTTLCYYQTIETTEGSVAVDWTDIRIDSAKCDITLQGRTQNLTNNIFLEKYIKEGDGAFREAGNGVVSLEKSAGYKKADVVFDNLKSGTAYTVSLRDSDGIEYGSFRFETPADDKKVEVVSVDAYLHRAQLKATLTGTAFASKTEYLNLFYREKGTENAWERKSTYIKEGTAAYSFYISEYNGSELKEAATYEYVLGIGSQSAAKDKLKAAVEGTFTTQKDERRLENTTAATGYSYACIETAMTGNSNQIASYICFFYKETGSGVWQRLNFYSTGNISYNASLYIKGLKAGTGYDYAVVISDSIEDIDIDKIPDERKFIGSFRTKEADYKLTFETDETSTANKEIITVKAEGTSEDAQITVALTLDNGQTQTLLLKQKAGYTGKAAFTNLTPETTYTIVKAQIKTYENIDGSTKTITIQSLEPGFTFTTKKAIIPESIRLSQEELKLNLAYGEAAVLKAVVDPATASPEIIWRSSNPDVAAVDSEGTVSANGYGEAVITAASAYDDKVTAECKVSVNAYVVALTDGAVPEQVYGVQADKGTYSSNVGFFEVTADYAYIAVSDFTVSSQKPSVADWENGSIHAKTIGCTDMIFDKNGYKAAVQVDVVPESAGFGITGLNTSDENYPAIECGENSYEIAYNEGLGLFYEVQGMISPEGEFDPYDFTWTSSDKLTAEVSEAGIITPKKTGTVTITVKPSAKKFTNPEKSTVVLTLSIKPTPTDSEPYVYAVTNEKAKMKLADVAFPEEWGSGWSWKEPQTPLYSLPVNSDAYAFDAVYTGDDYYAYEGSVNVYISTITGAYASEAEGNHRNVVMVSNGTVSDTLKIKVTPSYYGNLPESRYTVKIPDVKNLKITQNTDTGYFEITASKAGKYTIKPQILVGDKIAAKGSYTFKAVTDNQIEHIALSTDKKEGAVIDADNNRICFDASADTTTGSSFELRATAFDRDDNENTDTKLTWSITDKSVASLRISKDTRTATLQVKGNGHAVIQVTAKDAAAVSAQWKLEIQDHKPRVDQQKATVNLAYDYGTSEGQRLSYNQYGYVEIVPVYGEYINNVRLLDAAADETDRKLKIEHYSSFQWLIEPVDETVGTDKAYQTRIEVTTAKGKYIYPLTVSVIDQAPKVTAKVTKGINLFYIAEEGELQITLESSLYRIESMIWTDDAKENGNNAFEFSGPYTYTNGKNNEKYYSIRQDKVKVANGALVDAGVDSGTITVRLSGVRKAYQLPITVRTNYKKPSLMIADYTTGKAQSCIVLDMKDGNTIAFRLYDKLAKRYLSYSTGNVRSKYYYNEISCGNDELSLSTVSGSVVRGVYTGTNTQESLSLVVDSLYWREPLNVLYTIKAVEPKAWLSNNVLTYNTNYQNSQTVGIYIEGYCNQPDITDIVIQGADAKAQALLDDDRLLLISDGNAVHAQLNKLEYMTNDMPTGKYAYNLTPYYISAASGERKAMNTQKLTISFTGKAITAKTSGKGSIDLAQSYADSWTVNSIAVSAKFANIGSGYRVIGARLVGEYSKYFEIGKVDNSSYNPTYYIKIRSGQKGKLKAGHNYNLQVVYTLRATGGETIKVTGNVLKVKPKQKAPKITVGNNNQTLYAASDMSRSYTIYAPNSYYSITDANGSIDINKDGKADIIVSNVSSSGRTVVLDVYIADRDAVLAAANGKSYSIPISVKVYGRDGISKDASATIKVKVKR